jgi:indole-3-glycerol phosphate synthase
VAILDTILRSKRAEVERSKRRLPMARIAELAAMAPPVRGFARALRAGGSPRIIAEVKRASPSRGVLRPNDPPGAWVPEILARAYEAGGAAALSVLTDVHFFWGHPDALGACREATALPVLRKDFIVDPYQVDESRWLGADAVLLIARALDEATLLACAARAEALGMDVLLEVHTEAELAVAGALPRAVVGVNNRDLSTFAVDIGRSARLRAALPADRLVVAESGLQEPQQLAELAAAGVGAFLIGEHLARHDAPARELARLRGV